MFDQRSVGGFGRGWGVAIERTAVEPEHPMRIGACAGVIGGGGRGFEVGGIDIDWVRSVAALSV